MTTTLEQLRTKLESLSLAAIDARLETLLETAAKQEHAYADFLLEVMSTESDARRQRYLKTRLQLAPSAVPEDLRSVRLCLSTVDRRTADPRAAHVAFRA